MNSELKCNEYVFDKRYSGLLFIDGLRHIAIDKIIVNSEDNIVLFEIKNELVDNKGIIENRLNNTHLPINHRGKTLIRNVINKIENRIKYIDEKIDKNPSFESLLKITKHEYELIINRVKGCINSKNDLARFAFAIEECEIFT